MLVLSRRPRETIVITTASGERITVSVSEIDRQQVRIAIIAPQNVAVWRGEIQELIDRGEAIDERK